MVDKEEFFAEDSGGIKIKEVVNEYEGVIEKWQVETDDVIGVKEELLEDSRGRIIEECEDLESPVDVKKVEVQEEIYVWNSFEGGASQTEETYKYRSRFSSSPGLKNHSRSHKELIPSDKTKTRAKPVECSVCQAKFTHGGSLKVHMRLHNGEKPYECDICHNKFTRLGTLKSHMRLHTGEKPFGCETCGAKFNQGSQLRSHIRTHTGEKPYGCELCEENFAHSKTLKAHIRSHTGEKPYECQICAAKFTHGNSLKDHLRCHTGEKPFECNLCVAKFTKRYHLNRHLKTHAKF